MDGSDLIAIADQFEAEHNRELSAAQKRCGEILRDQIAEVERAAEKVVAKDAEIAKLRRRLKVAEDALKELQARFVASVYDGTLDPYEALKIAEGALAAIREPVTDCNRPEGGAK